MLAGIIWFFALSAVYLNGRIDQYSREQNGGCERMSHLFTSIVIISVTAIIIGMGAK